MSTDESRVSIDSDAVESARKIINEIVARNQLLDPPSDNATTAQMIEVSKQDVKADLRSIHDALTHFIQSIKHIPLYAYIETYVDQMVVVCSSVESMLKGDEPPGDITRGIPNTMAFANLLARTYNHYHGTDD